MNRLTLEKNRLDLAYKRNLQILNAILLVGIGSFVAYLAALILDPEKLFQYTLILSIIGIITYIGYKKIDDSLKNISNKIRSLLSLKLHDIHIT